MKILIFLVAISSVVSNAGTILPRPGQSKMQQLTKSVSKKQACTDFSGHWVGSCKSAEGETPVDMNISQQGCEYILLDSTFIAIGGSHQENDAIPTSEGDYYSSSTTYLNWDDARNTLISNAESYVSQTGKGVIYANKFAGAVGIENGKLVSIMQGEGVDVACTLEKN